MNINQLKLNIYLIIDLNNILALSPRVTVAATRNIHVLFMYLLLPLEKLACFATADL